METYFEVILKFGFVRDCSVVHCSAKRLWRVPRTDTGGRAPLLEAKSLRWLRTTNGTPFPCMQLTEERIYSAESKQIPAHSTFRLAAHQQTAN